VKKGVYGKTGGQEKKRKTKYACVECSIIYGDASDPKKDEDWLSCPTCNSWMHSSCFYATTASWRL